MKTIRRISGVTLLALATGGCVGSAVGAGLEGIAIQRYDDGGRNRGTRHRDYRACVAKDNTSFAALDACMAAEGYTVKE